MELIEENKLFFAIFLWICSFSSFGALRFQIAKMVYKIRDYLKNETK